MKKVHLLLIFLLITCSKASAVDLGVLVLYHPSLSKYKNPSTTIASYIQTTNQTYKKSLMPLKLKLLSLHELDIPNGEKVGDGVLNSLTSNQKIWALQDKYRPDITIYITMTNTTEKLCGKARFPKRENHRINSISSYSSGFNAIATSSWQSGCGEGTFIHEIGHILGAGHGKVNLEWEALGGLISGTERWHPGTPITTSVGHGHYDSIRTIMAHPYTYGRATRIFNISNPKVNVLGLPTGTTSRNASEGMVKIAKEIVQYNSAYYPTTRGKDKWGRAYRKRNKTKHCLKWKTSYSRTGTKRDCIKFDPN